MGEYDLGSEKDCDKFGYCAPPPQDFSPVQVTIHQQYNKPHKFHHDIALIKLDRDVLVNGRIHAAFLWETLNNVKRKKGWYSYFGLIIYAPVGYYLQNFIIFLEYFDNFISK